MKSLKELYIDKNGYIPSYKKRNQAFLEEIRKLPSLTPIQLLHLSAKNYRMGLKETGESLLLRAIIGLANNKKVHNLMQEIKNRDIGMSLWGDAWDGIKAVARSITSTPSLISGTDPDDSDPRDEYGSTAGRSGCDINCTPFGFMIEKCPRDTEWRIIGFCFGFSW